MFYSTQIIRQLTKFCIVGIGAVLVDLGFYYTFLNIFPENVFQFINNEDLSKSLSFLCGLYVSYTFNKFWTWKKKNSSNKRLLKFMVLYGISLILNVFVNSLLLDVLFGNNFGYISDHRYLSAFIGATAVSALVNFTGQKVYVFKH